MSTARKLAIVRALVIALAVWPLVHHALVVGYGMNPWHLFGFSMYCKPRAPIGVFLRDARGAEIPQNRLPPEINTAIATYAERRRVLGELARPDGLARDLFDSTPWLKNVQIAVVTYDFSASAARLEKKEYVYPYAR